MFKPLNQYIEFQIIGYTKENNKISSLIIQDEHFYRIEDKEQRISKKSEDFVGFYLPQYGEKGDKVFSRAKKIV